MVSEQRYNPSKVPFIATVQQYMPGGSLALPAISTGPVSNGASMGPVFGAGQGPTAATGQLADNPFQNTFNFQIPQPASTGGNGGSSAPASSGSGGVTSYLPLIVIGVITAGIAYYAFERKKK